MGQEIEKTLFTEIDYTSFQQRLLNETELLNSWFHDGTLANDALMGGFEIESWLLDECLKPLPLNKEFINIFNSDLVSPELAKFNLEFNNIPRNLTGNVLSDFHNELDITWKKAERVAYNLSDSSSLLLIGTLPTLTISDLNEHSMSDMNRYRALNNEIIARRKNKPVHLYIEGCEKLDLYSYDVMLEASTTSFQIHTKVPAQDAHHYYNAAIILSSPLVAISANSPYVFGKHLWNETRIPLFEQSIDTGNPKAPFKRVSFGSGFAQKSIMECFYENLRDFHILLPILFDDDADLAHLRLHNGTIWRWNRPLIGFNDNGQAHVRIEHRAIPAGPTIIDMLANASFFYGLQHYWAQQFKQGYPLPAFDEAKNNFYIAATDALQSNVQWFGKNKGMKSLLIDELLTQAEHGLNDLNINSNDIQKYLSIIEARIQTEQTGASWQKEYVSSHNCDMTELTNRYQTLQRTQQPIHSWQLNFEANKARKPTESLQLKQLESFPKDLLTIRAEELHTIFPEPTLLHLNGLRPETVFVSVLLHGNETTGFYVIQELLRKYENTRLPRSISIFFGNTKAAQHGLRFLDSQIDYNRVWPGTNYAHSHEAVLMQQIVDEMSSRKLFASIDIHNNTGLNPHYACINKLDNTFLQLASLFGPTVVYFLTPKGVQSMAFSKLCPSVTIECGKSDSSSGVNHALEFLDAVIHMKEISHHPISHQNINLFHTIARVKVPEENTFSFTDQNADILFSNKMEKMNFSEMPIDTVFGKIKHKSGAHLLAYDEDNIEVGRDMFYISGDNILLKYSMMPAMLTLDEMVIRQDCLCYLMERISIPK